MNWLLIIEMLVLLAVANGTPVLAKRIFGPIWDRPVDGHAHFADGRPWFGASKTIRGIALSLVATCIVSVAFGRHAVVGIVISLAAMAGDLISSFCKRRLDMPPSSMALGLDQIPESFLPLIAVRTLVPLTLAEMGTIVLAFFFFELALSRVLFRLHIRDQPY